MKKLTLVAVVAALTLVGCGGYESGTRVQDGQFEVVKDVGRYDLLRDIDTGCMYIESHRSDGGIAPYYDKDGKVAGCGK